MDKNLTNYDVFIPCAKKDYNKLKFLIKSLDNLIDFNGDVYICMETDEKINIESDRKIFFYTDKQVLDLKDIVFKHRHGWVYQQLLKLCQNITKNDNFLVIDSDIYINQPITIIENDRVNFFISERPVNTHVPYFYFMEKYGVKRGFKLSFINDFMLFNKTKIENMFSLVGGKNEFIEFVYENVSSECYPSEYELYGNFIFNNSGDYLNILTINKICNGKDALWSDDELVEYINKNKNNGSQVLEYHTWGFN
jgi:hypothetical protein